MGSLRNVRWLGVRKVSGETGIRDEVASQVREGKTWKERSKKRAKKKNKRVASQDGYGRIEGKGWDRDCLRNCYQRRSGVSVRGPRDIT